jgi:DNA-binding HxlR family transcriptional regulator
MPRTYAQLCPLAAGLDVIGDRWTLLIARELIQGPRRFTDLKEGLGAIGPTLLSERLREMEEDGLVEKVDLPPPAARSAYRLTARGADLEPVLAALGRWGIKELARPGLERTTDHTVAVGLRCLLGANPRSDLTATIDLDMESRRFTVQVQEGQVSISPGPPEQPADATLSGSEMAFLGIQGGFVEPREALRSGVLKLRAPRRIRADIEQLLGLAA